MARKVQRLAPHLGDQITAGKLSINEAGWSLTSRSRVHGIGWFGLGIRRLKMIVSGFW
jgi:hypothetical protein